MHQINWWKIIGMVLIMVIIIGVVTWSITYQITDHYAKSDPKLYQLREHLKDLHPAVKDITLKRANKSFTINKQDVNLCLYDENGKYYDDNMLIYVFIHELAHVITKSVGHTEEFHKNFSELLMKADEMKLYDITIPPLEDYCGHK